MCRNTLSSTDWLNSYFRPKCLRGFEPLQDGGISANNPIHAGRSETTMIWPRTEKPDLALSVGTGFVKSPELHTRLLHGIFSDGFCSRAFRSFMFSPSLHSENSWHTCVDSLSSEDRADFFRLNFPMTGLEVDLDDAELMGPLQSAVRAHVEAERPCEGIARALWASNFYFELDDDPSYFGGLYRCRGAILSRLEDCSGLVRNILRKFPEAAFRLGSGTVLGKLEISSCCRRCGFYRLPVAFDVRLLAELVTMMLRFEQPLERRISGFPASMSWVGAQQGLGLRFGRADHRQAFHPQNCACLSRKRLPSPLREGLHKRRRR